MLRAARLKSQSNLTAFDNNAGSDRANELTAPLLSLRPAGPHIPSSSIQSHRKPTTPILSTQSFRPTFIPQTTNRHAPPLPRVRACPLLDGKGERRSTRMGRGSSCLAATGLLLAATSSGVGAFIPPSASPGMCVAVGCGLLTSGLGARSYQAVRRPLRLRVGGAGLCSSIQPAG